jgi:hypothetical protein
MKTFRIAVLALAAVICLSVTVFAGDEPESFGGTVVGTAELEAVVENVSYETRELTLKDSTGETATYVVGPIVRNFDQIKKGDKVSMQFEESVTIIDYPGLETEPARGEIVTMEGAPAGEKPAGMIVGTTEVLAEVVAIDHEARTVTLKGPERTVTVQVDEAVENFDRVKQGDKVYLRFTEKVVGAVTAKE